MNPRYTEELRSLAQACDQVISRLPTQAMRDQAFAIFQRLAIVLTTLASEIEELKKCRR